MIISIRMPNLDKANFKIGSIICEIHLLIKASLEPKSGSTIFLVSEDSFWNKNDDICKAKQIVLNVFNDKNIVKGSPYSDFIHLFEFRNFI